jgi:hypothetical protein
MRSAILTVSLLVTALSAIRGQTSGAVDVSGVDRFWAIADEFRAGRDPSAAAWDSLFATPGYAALHRHERRRPALQLAFRAALLRPAPAVRDSLLATTTWTARVARHIETVWSRRTELDAARQRMAMQDLLPSALQLTQTLLPAGTIRRYGRPQVAFLFFLPDGRGYPELIVADLANVADKDDPRRFFAHEAVHFYYRRLEDDRRPERPAVLADDQRALLTLVTKLFEESVGDQFDKAPYVEAPPTAFMHMRLTPDRQAYMASYRAGVAQAPGLLGAIDSMLLRAATTSVDRLRDAADSLRRALPQEGRPIGYFMTRVIREQLGDEQLAATVGDPRAWLEKYDEAAAHAARETPRLSRAWVERVP